MGLLLPTLLKASEDKLLFGSDLRKPLEPTDSPAHCGQGYRMTAHPPRAWSNQKLMPSGSLMSIFPLPRADLRTREGFRILLSI